MEECVMQVLLCAMCHILYHTITCGIIYHYDIHIFIHNIYIILHVKENVVYGCERGIT